MPIIESHPMRLRRIVAGLSQQKLATLSGVSRATISQIEEGRTKRPPESVFTILGQFGGQSPEFIEREFARWMAATEKDVELSPRAQAALALPPSIVATYPSWNVWRSDIAPTPTAFASLLRVPRNTVAKYENNPNMSLPKSIMMALTTRFGVTPEYLQALMELPVDER